MGPLIARQYRRRSHALTPELTRNLLWRYSALGNLHPRITPFVYNSPVGAHADAQGLGHVAARYQGAVLNTVSVHLPTWFLKLANEPPGELPIFAFELCAAILMVCISLDWPRHQHRTCVLCVDNKAAVAALVKGNPTSKLGSLLTALFWNLATRGTTTWWAEYVHTKSNHADQPSRNCSASHERMCNLSNGQFPDTFRRVFKSWDALRKESTTVQQMKIVCV